MARARVHSRIAATVVLCTALSATNCSSDDPQGSDRSGQKAGTDAGGKSGSGTGGASDFGNVGSGNAGHMGTTTSLFDAGAIDPGANDCVGQTQNGNPVPVDMYIMLDRSDSMRETTGTGDSKWDAMRSALSTFIADPQSNGLGVGLQYFPLGAQGVPEMCNEDKECGANGGSCLSRVCQPPAFATSFTPTFCSSDAECQFPSGPCVQIGLCSKDATMTMACFNIGAGGCDTDGDCVLRPGECTDYASCQASDYAAPAVAIAALPKNASALTKSLMTENPIGLTPTSAALSGAIDRVATQAGDNPTHRVIAVLATDGLPTVCVDQSVQTQDQAVAAVATIAAAGLAGTPRVETYVIGVFAADDPDPVAKLDSIATAGGTTKAFIVDASQDVAQQFLDALAKIRGGSLDCEFQLPDPPKGETLDYQLVNVQVTSDGKPRDLFYVRTADDCGKTDLGWYYDVDPTQGGTPTQIRVCDQTCTAFHDLPDATVDIKLGCATRGPD